MATWDWLVYGLLALGAALALTIWFRHDQRKEDD